MRKILIICLFAAVGFASLLSGCRNDKTSSLPGGYDVAMVVPEWSAVPECHAGALPYPIGGPEREARQPEHVVWNELPACMRGPVPETDKLPFITDAEIKPAIVLATVEHMQMPPVSEAMLAYEELTAPKTTLAALATRGPELDLQPARLETTVTPAKPRAEVMFIDAPVSEPQAELPLRHGPEIGWAK